MPMTKVDQHAIVLDAQQALDRAAKTVAMCQREVESIEREIDRNMANQVEAFTNGGDPSNPLGKRRKPTSFGKLIENRENNGDANQCDKQREKSMHY